MELGKNIRRFREMKGYSQEKLAEFIGVSTIFISRIEQGKKAPGIDNFIKIANVLSASADELFGYQIETMHTLKESKLSMELEALPLNERRKIYSVIDVMISNYYGGK